MNFQLDLLPSQHTPPFFSILILLPFLVFALLALLSLVSLFIAVSLLILPLGFVLASRPVCTA